MSGKQKMMRITTMSDRVILRDITDSRMTWKQALDIAEAQIKKLGRKIIIDEMRAIRFYRIEGASDWRQWVYVYVQPIGMKHQIGIRLNSPIGEGIREIGFYSTMSMSVNCWDRTTEPIGTFLEK